MILKGERILLRPLDPEERDLFAQWALDSDATPFLYGEQTGDRIPTREELFEDYASYYFDGSRPERGRCFGIECEGKLIGQVNYNEIDSSTRSVELDIWIADKRLLNKGLGSEALGVFADYLFLEFDIDRCYLIPPASNIRAIKAYERAGFVRKAEFKEQGVDWIYMEKTGGRFCE